MRYIKTIAAIAFAGAAFTMQAQRSLVNGINFYLTQSPPELENAKIDIDKAAENPSTSNWGDMWYWRGKTYMFIANYKPELDPNAGYVSAQSYVNYLKSTDKKSESDMEELLGTAESDGHLVAAAGACYNEAVKYAQEGKVDEATKRYEIIVEMMTYDKNERLTKYNLTKNQMYLACYQATTMDSTKTQLGRDYLQKLIDNKYNDPKLYMFLAQSYQNEGNTDKAIEYLEKGLKAYPDDAKMFLIEEINLYFEKDQTDVLMQKLDQAIVADPTNELLYFNRGILYQEKNMYAPALKDFEKVLELRPDYGDAKISLASVLLDSGKILNKELEKIKDTKSKAYTDLEAQTKELFSKSLVILDQLYNEGLVTKPEEIIGVLRSIRDIYAQLHDEAKRAEYNALIKQKKTEFKME